MLKCYDVKGGGVKCSCHNDVKRTLDKLPNTSGWNAIIGNSDVRKIETNRHFCTVCKG